MKITKIVDLGYEERISYYGNRDFYCMCFCYPKSGPILIKGMKDLVHEYIKKHLGICHYERLTFNKGIRTSHWFINYDGIYTGTNKEKSHKQNPEPGRKKFTLIRFDENSHEILIFKGRKYPRKYIKEFDNF